MNTTFFYLSFTRHGKSKKPEQANFYEGNKLNEIFNGRKNNAADVRVEQINKARKLKLMIMVNVKHYVSCGNLRLSSEKSSKVERGFSVCVWCGKR